MNDDKNTALYAFRTFGDIVLRAAFSGTGDMQEAEDITQEVFLTLHSKPRSFNDDEHMKAWLLRAVINRCRNYKKSFRSSMTDHLDDLSAEPAVPFTAEENELKEKISAMPAKYSSVLFLYYYEGYTIKEIADIIGKKENTVSSLLRRGRKKLRSVLEEEGSL